MLYCRNNINNYRVEMALAYLPENILDNINGKVAFTEINSDACRLGPILCEYKEIILLSPWIFPHTPFSKNDRGFRYFIFCILHEVAHVIFTHKSPMNCSGQENQRQENEANDLALKWFNAHVSKFFDQGLLPLSIEEIRVQQEVNQKRLASFLESPNFYNRKQE